ncbi:hypothetical protein NQ314_000316 [Rhamnusium bicolor]|uniref:DDE Tnp4 domain-containing protein n=1 Tax=Rhamnusium bicolor TaxID=1586634 RepID=A0AAV8ZV92_9CUCU|nr:hypothetical protein NQ314_000316 [Rhamnusium bicolor]
MLNGSLGIPPASPISDEPVNYPFVIIEDEVFPLSENLLRPYGGENLSYEKEVFNYRLSRARRYIECCFGILANKWRIFHRPLNVNINIAQDIIKVCCLLHNFVRVRDGRRYDETMTIGTMDNVNADTRS